MRALRTARSTSPRFSPRFGTITCTRRSARPDSHASSSSASSGVARQVHLRRRGTIFVELLDRRLQNFRGRSRNALVRGQLDALEHASAAHHEHMHHRAGRTHVQAERIAIAQAHGGDLLLTIAQRLNGSRGVAQMRRLFEPLGGRRPPSSNSVSRSISSSFLPSKNSCVRCTASSYCSCEQIAATQGAMQRLMSYSRHGRSRLPVITSLHDRMPNSRCVSPIVRRASDAGMNGPA